MTSREWTHRHLHFLSAITSGTAQIKEVCRKVFFDIIIVIRFRTDLRKGPANQNTALRKFEDVLGPDSGDRGESKYDVTTSLRQKHVYSSD